MVVWYYSISHRSSGVPSLANHNDDQQPLSAQHPFNSSTVIRVGQPEVGHHRAQNRRSSSELPPASTQNKSQLSITVIWCSTPPFDWGEGISDHCCNVSLSVRPKSQSHHPQFQESASRRHACLGREIQSYKIDYSAVLLAEIRRPAGGPAGLIGRCCSRFCFWFVLVSVLGLYLFLCPRIFASSESKSPPSPPQHVLVLCTCTCTCTSSSSSSRSRSSSSSSSSSSSCSSCCR